MLTTASTPSVPLFSTVKFQTLNYAHPDGPDFVEGDTVPPIFCRDCPSRYYIDAQGAFACSRML